VTRLRAALTAALAAALGLLLVRGQSGQVELVTAATPEDALALAWQDLQQVPLGDRPFTRYVWVTDGADDSFRCVSLMLNDVSRAGSIRRPVPVEGKTASGSRVLLARFDLRWYATEKHARQWLDLWEELRHDPAFSLLVSRSTLQLARALYGDEVVKAWVTRVEEQIIDCPPYVHPADGKVYERRRVKELVRKVEFVKLSEVKDFEVLRLPSPRLDAKTYLDLSRHAGSDAAVVSDLYAGLRLLHTIRDDGLYAQLYGGLYYDFAGIPRADPRVHGDKATDEDALYLELGLALDPDKGVTAPVLLSKLRGDRRVAMTRSNVTGGPRMVEMFRTQVGPVGETQGVISVSHDLRQKNIDLRLHPLANLLRFRDDAREIIFEGPNGLHRYAMHNGQGQRQDEVPADIANDRTIPAPHPPRLDSLSCKACHEARGDDGWIELTNDVTRLVGAYKRLDIFGDLDARDKALDQDTLERLHTLYSGDLGRALQQGRDDYARAVLQATGPWPGAAEKAQANVVKVAVGHLVNNLRRHRYELVTPETALKSLGVQLNWPAPAAGPHSPATEARDKKARDDRALKLLNELLPPDDRAAVTLPDGRKIVPEDPRIALLKAGVGVSRQDWDQAFGFAYERAGRTAAVYRNRQPVKVNN